jgi:tRNA dimethylallyltransferase
VNTKKTVIIITGPTASGKTALSLQLAKHFKTEIISADSRQCFKELNIGVAKPTEQELKSVKHYFINSHSIHDNVNAQIFEKYALKSVNEIFEKNDVAIMVGGTGMYIKAFCEGLDEIPVLHKNIRDEIIKNYTEKGLIWLQNKVQQKDPLFWKQAEQKNPQRLMRALEVIESTGKSITAFRTNNKVQRPFSIKKIGISLSKEQLHANIEKRVDEMIDKGLVEEVKTLYPYKSVNALQTVGYKEIFTFLDEKISLLEAKKQIKTNTRQYAKRQLTWFKKDAEIKWIKETNPAEVLKSK